MRVAIVENTAVTHHGQVGVALHEAGAKIELFKPWRDQRLPTNTAEFDAVVVFGGEQSALDDRLHPYLPRLAAAMRGFSLADKAVLGICLGAQVLARAFGAANHLDTGPEFGWCDVMLTEEGQADPVLGTLPASFPIFQWHSDTFTLPACAAHLARSSAAAHQGFRIGRATYGLQFHFEANRRVVADWNREFPNLIAQKDAGFAAALPDGPGAAGIAADAAGLTIARSWVALI